MLHAFRSQAFDRPVVSNTSRLLDYLRFDMGSDRVETVRVLHLNARLMLLRDEVVGEGTVDEAPVYVREITRRALELGSTALIMVHNHPSGDPEPSRADIDVTKRLGRACELFRIHLHDHFIVTARGHSSMRAMGLL